MRITAGLLLIIATGALCAPSGSQGGPRADTCGKVAIGQRNNVQSFINKIVGGSEATPYSWPWQVGLRLRLPGNSPIFFCGGSIIAKKWVITAGHCCDLEQLHPAYGGSMEVFVGTHRKQNVQYNDVFAVRRFIKHPYYSMTPMIVNDMCLLELERELTYSMRVQPVCLAQGEWPAGTECFASGWGSINFSPSTSIQPDALQETNVHLVSESSCRRTYDIVPNINIGDHTICALKHGAGPCKGDSGGPLVCRRGDRWELVGVTSAVSMAGCGHPFFPTVFANVVTFGEWITSYTGTLL
ncbi:CUB and peptidase domain-containing protein 2-like [Paramacrobiotus metropolitanus]|uniref:CUB and peptidase domain-containing protein 2-like n=1 Tax=Paramacrobiotus metropolitanus TaxID=2943436 RepID=UPI0024458723|nr:CUB and peptidase domain-containing protein 2-like [Paramacrobiotus metropolitanus]